MSDEAYRKQMLRNIERSREFLSRDFPVAANGARRIALEYFYAIRIPTQRDLELGLALAVSIDDEVEA